MMRLRISFSEKDSSLSTKVYSTIPPYLTNEEVGVVTSMLSLITSFIDGRSFLRMPLKECVNVKVVARVLCIQKQSKRLYVLEH